MVICFLLVLLALEAVQPLAHTNNVPVTDEDVDILISLYKKFKCQFHKENKPGQKQYTVFYYGDPKVIDKIDFNLCKLENKNIVFLTSPDYTLDHYTREQKGCSFTAARLKSTSHKHTEKSCLYSFGEMIKGHINYTRCPRSPDNKKGNVYMYSYRNPCAGPNYDPGEIYCTTVISHFAKDCGDNFKHMIIGYQEIYQESEQQSLKIISETANVAMKKIDFPYVECLRNEL